MVKIITMINENVIDDRIAELECLYKRYKNDVDMIGFCEVASGKIQELQLLKQKATKFSDDEIKHLYSGVDCPLCPHNTECKQKYDSFNDNNCKIIEKLKRLEGE